MNGWLREKIRHYVIWRRQRRQLLEMDERMYKDLAISRVDAEQLAGRFGVSKNSDNARGEK